MKLAVTYDNTNGTVFREFEKTRVIKVYEVEDGEIIDSELVGTMAKTTEDIIGVFDLDNTTVNKATRDYLNEAQKADVVKTVTFDLPTFRMMNRSMQMIITTKIADTAAFANVLLTPIYRSANRYPIVPQTMARIRIADMYFFKVRKLASPHSAKMIGFQPIRAQPHLVRKFILFLFMAVERFMVV